jgi:hypothetical protein
MSKLNVEAFQNDDLRIEPADLPEGGVELRFSGTIDMRDPSAILLPYYDHVHDQVTANKAPEVRLDLRNLAYLNSSGILTLVKWIKKLQDTPAEQKYKFHIVYSGDINWQRISILTISKMAADVVTVSKA